MKKTWLGSPSRLTTLSGLDDLVILTTWRGLDDLAWS